MSAIASPVLQTTLSTRFRAARRQTIELCEPLTPEDMMVQSCPEASPAKWHLAHTTWFFESFVLREFLPDYRLFDPDFPWLFNSYYESFSAFPEKRLRSSFSRPGLEEVLRYREHVDAAIERLLEREPERGGAAPHRTGREPRGAASGTAAHRHPARLLHQSAATSYRNQGTKGTGERKARRRGETRRSHFRSLRADCARLATRATDSASTMSCRAIASGSSRMRSPIAWSPAGSLLSLWPMAVIANRNSGFRRAGMR